jgi:hypothetical protein
MTVADVHSMHTVMRCAAGLLPYTSPPVSVSSGTPVVFYTYFYDPAHRPRLEKLLYLEISNGHFKPFLDPGGCFNSETATRRFQK